MAGKVVFLMSPTDIREKSMKSLVTNDARRISFFGSFARGEAGPGSDLDGLVEFLDWKSLLELVRLERELSDRLGMRVDLLAIKSISPHLIERIMDDMEVIYG